MQTPAVVPGIPLSWSAPHTTPARQDQDRDQSLPQSTPDLQGHSISRAEGLLPAFCLAFSPAEGPSCDRYTKGPSKKHRARLSSSRAELPGLTNPSKEASCSGCPSLTSRTLMLTPLGCLGLGVAPRVLQDVTSPC